PAAAALVQADDPVARRVGLGDVPPGAEAAARSAVQVDEREPVGVARLLPVDLLAVAHREQPGRMRLDPGVHAAQAMESGGAPAGGLPQGVLIEGLDPCADVVEPARVLAPAVDHPEVRTSAGGASGPQWCCPPNSARRRSSTASIRTGSATWSTTLNVIASRTP